ncbi:hypothetical protein [Streptomyces griseus]|uniref:hypothetical protein n=1 Tax=Streptomyces griseus TaxID=1911 RepID=UPI003404745A
MPIPNYEVDDLCRAWNLLQEAREALAGPAEEAAWRVLEQVVAETARRWYFSKPRDYVAQCRRDDDRAVIDAAGIPVGPPHGFRPMYVQ